MFNLYEYLLTIYHGVEVLQKIYRASGIADIEEMLSDLRNNPNCCLMVRDGGDGRFELRDRRLNTAYHTFWVFTRAKVNDHDSRLAAKRLSMAAGIRLIDCMRADAIDFNAPAYGLNDESIDYTEIGPIGQNYYGYSFNFLVSSSVPKYVPPPVYPDGTYLIDADDNAINDDSNTHLIE